MTPKEKAKDLVNDFWKQITFKLGEDTSKARAKKCALIVVDGLFFLATAVYIKREFIFYLPAYTQTKFICIIPLLVYGAR